MSPLKPKLLLDLLVETPLPHAPVGDSQGHRRRQRDSLLPMAAVVTALGFSVAQNPAPAQVTTPTQINFGSGSNATGFPTGAAVNADFETEGVGPAGPTGVNLRFNLDTSADGGNQSNRPLPGNELEGFFPENPPAGPPPAPFSPVAADDVAGLQNPNTPLTGGLPPDRGNILLGLDSGTLGGFQIFSVELFNAAGDAIPANNITYTLVDIDRSCNRDVDGSILWQDVVATRVVQTPTGIGIQPTVVNPGGPINPGQSGTPGGISETVENITGLAGAGFLPAVNSLTFRGITDPTAGLTIDGSDGLDPLLTAENGNTNCNDPFFETANFNPDINSPPAPPNDPDALTGTGGFANAQLDAGGNIIGTIPDNDDNRNVEAANNINQPPFQQEGNVELSVIGQLADRVEFQFGNGVQSGAINGLGDNLSLDPEAHGVGVLGEFSFEPAVIGISETSNDPIFQTTGPFAGQFIVKYSLLVENSGQVDLTAVEVTNDLDATFGAGNFSVVPGSLTLDDVVQANDAGFTGTGTGNVIPIPGTLEAGGSRIVMFEVAFDAVAAEAATGQGFFSNQSTVEANPIDPQTGLASTVFTVRDRSSNADTVETLNIDADTDDPDDGDPNDLGLPGSTFTNPFNPADPDFGTITRVDGDNDPSNNDSPTIVSVSPEIGVTKQVLSVETVSDGVFDVTYRHFVCNLGGTVLNNVRLTEDLNNTFRIGQANGVDTYTLQSISSPATAPAGLPGGFQQFTVNTALEGQTDAGLVGTQELVATTGNTLNPNDCSIVDFVVRVTPGANTGDDIGGDPPFDSQVVAIGTGPAIGANPAPEVTDLSDDVTSFPGGSLPIAEQLPSDNSTPPNGTATDPVDGAGAPVSNPSPALDPQSEINENNVTPVVFLPPQIGVTKQITDVEDNSDGTFTVSYRQIVCNIGNEDLTGVALTETLTLDEIFRVGQTNGVTSATLIEGSVVSPDTAPDGFNTAFTQLTVVPGFSGTDSLQLTAGDALDIGECGIVDYQVLVDPTDPDNPLAQNLGDGTLGDPANDDPAFEAQVEATGTGTLSGTAVSDLSDDVSNLPPADQLPQDLTGNFTATDGPTPGVPGGPENDPTPVTLIAGVNPEIGLTKQITNVVDNGIGADGRQSFDVTFQYLVCNTGDVPLNGLVISDNYDEQFNANGTGPVADYQVLTVTPGASEADGPLVEDPNAEGSTTGSGLITLASGGDLVFDANNGTVAGCSGESAVLETVVRVFDPDLSATFQANAIASAISVADGQAVSDLSDDVPQFGTADPANGIGTPGPGAVSDTPTSLLFSPLQLFKRITSVTSDGVTTTFPNVVGSVPDESFVGEIDARDPNSLLQAGDEVEYVIYYFNASDQALTNVEICDPLPSPLSIVPGSLSATPQGSGVFVSPLTPLPSSTGFGRSCADGSAGEQGAAVFDVGTVAPQTSGSVTFRAQIQ